MSARRTSHASRGRSLARRLAMQALYQWQMTSQTPQEIAAQFRDSDESVGSDQEYFAELLQSVVARHADLDAAIAAHADRPVEQLDPVEHAILLIGLYELTQRPDVPYRVVINEAIELSKRFGATDGHKYINALLDRAAREHRVAERGSPPPRSAPA